MDVIAKLEKRFQDSLKNEIRDFSSVKCNALVIDDDYVNYLYLNEILKLLNINVFRAVSFEEIIKEMLNIDQIDLLIVNVSQTDITTKGIKYLRQTYSVPLIVVDNPEIKSNLIQEIVDISDGVVSINADTNCFVEIISDVLKKSF